MAGLIKLIQYKTGATSLNCETCLEIYEMKRDTLNMLRRVFLSNKKEARDAFREFGGFISCASLVFALLEG